MIWLVSLLVFLSTGYLVLVLLYHLGVNSLKRKAKMMVESGQMTKDFERVSRAMVLLSRHDYEARELAEGLKRLAETKLHSKFHSNGDTFEVIEG